MSHNALIRGGTGSGSWTGVVVTTTDMETFDQRQFESINGDLGGTWAPAAAIIIGGAGLSVTGTTFSVSTAGAAFTGGLSISGGNLSVFGGTEFSGNVTFDTGVTAQVASGAILTVDPGALFTCGATAGFAGTLSISGATTISGTITASGASTFSANATFSGATFSVQNTAINLGNSSSTITIVGPVALLNSGHICKRVSTLSTPPGTNLDSDTHIGVTNASAVTADIVKPGVITANRTYIVDDATEGAEIEVSLIALASAAFIVTLVRSDSSPIIILQNSTLIPYGVSLVWHSSQWQVKYAIRH